MNPIAERSRKQLVAALLDLMSEHPYRDITITEITRRAQLSRRTYYRNFGDKDEILAAHCRELVGEYVHRLRELDDDAMPRVVRLHFAFWTQHLDFLRLLDDNGLDHLVLDKYNEYVAQVAADSGSTKYGEMQRRDYALAFNAGGYCNLLFAWLRRGARDTPEEMAEAFAAFEHP